MDKERIELLVENWLDEEKRPLMAKGHKLLFEFLTRADEELIRDFPEIAKVYQEMRNKRRRL